MILSSVSETLAPVSHHPALESVIAALRRGAVPERLAGLTETAKALVAAIVATELRRPMVVLVESGAGGSFRRGHAIFLCRAGRARSL